MVLSRLGAFLVFAGSVLYSQAVQEPRPDAQTQWQVLDQLCGQLQLAAPKKKHIIVDGKSESRLYTVYLERATVTLYPAMSREEDCCNGEPIATTQSGSHGAFELEGRHRGAYWLRVQKNELLRTIPVRLTHDFDKKTCRDPSVGRSVVVDSNPPKIETRIR